MNNTQKLKSNFFLALLASLTLGLAPFYPEPHILGKIRWVAGGGEGMSLMDYGDLIMHGLPWIFLLYFSSRLGASFFSSSNSTIKMQLVNLLKEEKVNIIDVREPMEFKSGHVQGAKNIPLSMLGNRVSEFKKMQGPIVLYCRSGARSGQATGFLKSQGFENVFNGGSVGQMSDYLRAA